MKRRVGYAGRKSVIAAIVLLMAGGLMLADRSGFFGRRDLPDTQKYDGKNFKVVHVTDGDTLDIDIPDGKWRRTRIRLWGMDTPETKKPNTPVAFFGPEASEFATKVALGKTVTIRLESGKGSRDKYGRLLAWVELPDGRLLNRVLVEQGYAYADPRFPNHLEKELRRLQAQAQKDRRGLWVHGPPSDMPEYYSSGRYKLPTR
jgi:micrococcal nuclease